MSNAKVNFCLDGINLILECSKEEKMRDICQRYAAKVGRNLKTLVFLYGGTQLRFDLSFKNQANSIDNNNNEMNVLVYQISTDELICPKCGEKINLNSEILDEVVLTNNNIKNKINGIQLQLDNAINNSLINPIDIQLNNIKIILQTIIDDIKKNNEKIQKLVNSGIDNNISNVVETNNINNKIQNKNEIKCVLDITSDEIGNNIVLFNSELDDGINVFLNNEKINMVKEDNKWIIDYDLENEGKYEFNIVLNTNITNMKEFFSECQNIVSIDFSDFNSSNITDMSNMFNNCKKLKQIIGLNNLITKNVTNMKSMFQQCNELEFLDLSNFDTRNVTDMSWMFNNCNKLKVIYGINVFKTNNVTDMKAMFKECNELKSLDLSNFNTKNVTNMGWMFNNCNNLKNIKGLEYFVTSKVIDMNSIFQLCKELEYLDFSNFDTSNVTNMGCMFDECTSLKGIKGINNFITNKVTDMNSMFQYCNKLEYLDLSNFDTSNVINMSFMFNKCNKLKEIKGINKFITSKVTDMKAMFNECNELESLDLSNFDTSNVTNMGWMFCDCNKLKYLNLLNFYINCENEDMLSFAEKNKCEFITNNSDLLNLFYSS